jgi:predicted transcriptional regulator
MVTDWTKINEYEERYGLMVDSFDAMERDIEAGRVGTESEADKSLRWYYNDFKDKLDDVCCKVIFGKHRR